VDVVDCVDCVGCVVLAGEVVEDDCPDGFVVGTVTSSTRPTSKERMRSSISDFLFVLIGKAYAVGINIKLSRTNDIITYFFFIVSSRPCYL